MNKIVMIKLVVLTVFVTLSGSIYPDEVKYKDYTDIGFISKSDLTIKQIIESPKEFHRDIVTVEGEITELEYKQLFTGRKFTLFVLHDGDSGKLKVYARGFIEQVGQGSHIRITGRYSKEKSFFLKKFKNVMKARKIHILNS